MSALSREFIAFAVACEAIRFGSFRTKAGRESPYFLNTGVFDDGERLYTLAQFYAKAIVASGLPFDMLFGAAYKGIPLVAGVAIALAAGGRNVPFCFNRKEAKDHGEGGSLVGAPLKGRVVIVDDVISAGTSVRESVETIIAHGARPAGVLIALDRMERGTGALSAVQEVRETYGIPVTAIATLDDVMAFIGAREDLAKWRDAVTAYRAQYGAA